MKKLIVTVLLSMLLFTSCGNDNDAGDDSKASIAVTSVNS